MKKLITDLIERAVKTAAQTALAGIGTASMIDGVNWKQILSIVGMSTIMSVLTSIVSANFGEKGTAGIINLHKEV